MRRDQRELGHHHGGDQSRQDGEWHADPRGREQLYGHHECDRGGTLIVNGDQSTATGAVSVADTATLGGIGSVGGATTFASGSTLSPGTSAGNISQALDFASLTMAAGSFWLVDLVNAVANDSDLVSVVNSGGLSISGALTINEVSGTFTPTTGYRVASYTGALGGLGRFSNDNGSGLITSGVGNTWSINYSCRRNDVPSEKTKL